MTVFDYVVLAILLGSMLLGLWRGVIGEAIALGAWVLAILGARRYGVWLAENFLEFVENPNLRLVLAWAIIFIVVLLLLSACHFVLKKLIRATGLGVSNQMLGMLFGALRGALIVLILVAAGGLTLLPEQDWWQQAALAPSLESVIISIKHFLPEMVAERINFR